MQGFSLGPADSKGASPLTFVSWGTVVSLYDGWRVGGLELFSSLEMILTEIGHKVVVRTHLISMKSLLGLDQVSKLKILIKSTQ